MYSIRLLMNSISVTVKRFRIQFNYCKSTVIVYTKWKSSYTLLDIQIFIGQRRSYIFHFYWESAPFQRLFPPSFNQNTTSQNTDAVNTSLSFCVMCILACNHVISDQSLFARNLWLIYKRLHLYILTAAATIYLY